MSRKDIIVLVILIGLWLAWPVIDRQFIKPMLPQKPAQPAAPAEDVPGEGVEDGRSPAVREPPALAEATPEGVAQAPASTPVPHEEESPPEKPEETVALVNDRIALTVSSHGAAIISATLKEYPQTIEPDSPPVTLDFGTRWALAYEGLPGSSSRSDFDVQVTVPDREVVLERELPSGLRVRRTIALGDGYLLDVADELINGSSQPVALPGYSIHLGLMSRLDSGPAMKGMVYLGMDTLSPGGEKVQHFGKRIAKMFKQEMKEKGLPKLPVRIELHPHENAVDWVSAKNKYFVQILTPEDGGEYCRLFAEREILPQEKEDPSFAPRMTSIEGVSASVYLPERLLQPGETVSRSMGYYVGPKKYTELARSGLHQVDVMEFGRLAPISKILLTIMNAIYDKLWPHNYGLAIMLLTVLIRIVFWPVTHKSTESMKRMQEIQPLVSELREKYKDNSQKQQQEIMALYKEHKVNPLGGCLPMLVQIPVFIALFVVLRSAIELRFAPFLWIRDLSEPENLFRGMIPVAGSLNILPLVMAGTMFWQQKMTPTGGDSQQQKMMQFMPVMMLVLFYKFASGLVLYWTTNQCLMIAQQLITKRKQAAKAAAAGDQ